MNTLPQNDAKLAILRFIDQFVLLRVRKCRNCLRSWLKSGSAGGYRILSLLSLMMLASHVQAEGNVVTISMPGPGAVAYLPVDLAPLIGADKEEGLTFKISHVSGGGLALNQLMDKSADFAAVGLPAFMSLRTKDGKVVGVSALSDLPLMVLGVRKDLSNSIFSVKDLKGRKVGVSTSSLTSKTAGTQLAELLILNAGLKLEDVTLVAAGQSFAEHESVLKNKTVDVLMTDATIATQLYLENQMTILVNLGDPMAAKQIPGARYLHATLGTREEVIQQQPQLVEKMTRIMRRTLSWLGSHTPRQVMEKMQVTDPEERKALQVTLMIYRHMFSTDGKFSAEQLKETETFFRNANPTNKAAQTLELKTMIDTRWAGSKS